MYLILLMARCKCSFITLILKTAFLYLHLKKVFLKQLKLLHANWKFVCVCAHTMNSDLSIWKSRWHEGLKIVFPVLHFFLLPLATDPPYTQVPFSAMSRVNSYPISASFHFPFIFFLIHNIEPIYRHTYCMA